jgi:hypothetical protein
MPLLIKAPIALLLSLAFFGCSRVGVNTVHSNYVAGSLASVVMADRHGLESAETPIELAKSEIMATPLGFFIPYADDEQAWERARFFLEGYLGRSKVANGAVVSRIVNDRWSLLSNPLHESYLYEVSKQKIEGGFSYIVSCRAGNRGIAEQARLNAGNFARFIREGKLELALLVN